MEKLNNYIPSQNIPNLTRNVTSGFLSDEKVQITIDYSVLPATVTIKEGSIIEVNRNRYRIENGDFSFQMDNASHNYITFTDNPSVSFSSSSSIGSYDPEKYGYYQIDGVSRTLSFYIDQSNETCLILYESKTPDHFPFTKKFDRIKVYMSTSSFNSIGKIPFDTIVEDELLNFDTSNYNYTVIESGYYILNLKLEPPSSNATSGSFICQIRKNTIVISNLRDIETSIQTGPSTIVCSFARSSKILTYLDKGDIIDFYVSFIAATMFFNGGSEYETYATIERIL